MDSSEVIHSIRGKDRNNQGGPGVTKGYQADVIGSQSKVTRS